MQGQPLSASTSTVPAVFRAAPEGIAVCANSAPPASTEVLMKSLRFIIVLSSIFSAKVDLFNLPWVTYLLKIVTYSLFFLHLKILFLHLHCTTTGVQYRWEGPSGPHRSVSEVSVREPRQRRCRRSEAEPHAPPGLSP